MLMITMVVLLNCFLVVRYIFITIILIREEKILILVNYSHTPHPSRSPISILVWQMVNRNERKEEFRRDDLPLIYQNDLVNE